MVWKKGDPSPNPKGRAVESTQKQRIAKELLQHLLPRAAEVYAEMLSEKDNKGFAAKEIFDRCCGKPPQAVELSGKDGGPLVAKIVEGS